MILNVGCVAVWAAGGGGSFWPEWVMLVSGLRLLRDGWRLLGPAADQAAVAPSRPPAASAVSAAQLAELAQEAALAAGALLRERFVAGRERPSRASPRRPIPSARPTSRRSARSAR